MYVFLLRTTTFINHDENLHSGFCASTTVGIRRGPRAELKRKDEVVGCARPPSDSVIVILCVISVLPRIGFLDEKPRKLRKTDVKNRFFLFFFLFTPGDVPAEPAPSASPEHR